MSFTVTLTTVALMLAYAIPGFILIKCRKADTHSISTLATLLLYVCSPFQTAYAMQQIEYDAALIAPLFLSLGLGLLLMGGMLGAVLMMVAAQFMSLALSVYINASCAAFYRAVSHPDGMGELYTTMRNRMKQAGMSDRDINATGFPGGSGEEQDDVDEDEDL